MWVVHVHGGALAIRWTWLPFWLAIHPHLMATLDSELHDRALLGGITTSDEDLEAMHHFVVRRICEHFPAFKGLDTYLNAVHAIST